MLPSSSSSFILIVIICVFGTFSSAVKRPCSMQQFACVSDGKCIPKLWHCDGQNDCKDGSDEMYCRNVCPPKDHYNCTRVKKCIPKSWLCDGTRDCEDNDDEDSKLCFKRPCNSKEFSCKFKIGTCIPQEKQCDGVIDCPDSSDEAPEVCAAVMSTHSTCEADEFRCRSGTCISKIYQCDGKFDCLDSSDEDQSVCSHARDVISCDSRQFKCLKIPQCIDISQKCNGIADCRDGTDELMCDYSIEGVSSRKVKRPDGSSVFDTEPPKDGSGRLITANNSSCPLGTDFFCGVGDPSNCIADEWVCDGSPDCANGRDEINCPPVHCKSDEFKCKSHDICISNILRCEGTVHCPDQSDEMDCPPPRGSNKSCNPLTEFDCKGDGLKCIPLGLVCDRHNDCGSDEDENLYGKKANCQLNPCRGIDINNGGCSHDCINRYTHALCNCPPGYRLMADNRTCEDIDECTENPHICSQICINTKGSFKCDCFPGYTKNFTDPHRCTAPGEKILLYATGNSIHQLLLVHNEIRPVVDSPMSALAIDYDFHASPKRVFWSQVLSGAIGTAQLHERTDSQQQPHTVLTTNVTLPDGLAYDWIHGLLFWTDTSLKRISVMNVTTGDWAVLLDSGLDDPRAIAVDPVAGRIYWNDWGGGRLPRIETMAMDGSKREVLVSSDLAMPNGLAIDLVHKRLYWGDAKQGSINSLDLTAVRSPRNTVVRSPLLYPYSLAVFEDLVYWSDWRAERIFAANKHDGSEMREVARASRPMGIRIVHAMQQPREGGDNARYRCAKAPCSHICLPGLESSGALSPAFACLCPQGWTTAEDKAICSPPLATSMADANNVAGQTPEARARQKRIVAATLATLSVVLIVAVGIAVAVTLRRRRWAATHQHLLNSFLNPIYQRRTGTVSTGADGYRLSSDGTPEDEGLGEDEECRSLSFATVTDDQLLSRSDEALSWRSVDETRPNGHF